MPRLLPAVRGGHGELAIPTRLLAAIYAEGWSRWPLETGGVLLGHAHGSEPVTVTVVIGPGPAAVHEAQSLLPDHAWQADQVERAWRADRGLAYLGDWHTHPQGRPRLSAQDVSALRLIAASPPAKQPHPVMLVAALSATGAAAVAAERLISGRARRLGIRTLHGGQP